MLILIICTLYAYINACLLAYIQKHITLRSRSTGHLFLKKQTDLIHLYGAVAVAWRAYCCFLACSFLVYAAVVVAWRFTAVSWRVPHCFLACLLVFLAVFLAVTTAGNTLE